MDDDSDRSRREFIAEGEELLDSLGVDLVELNARGARARPELINKIFRDVHSLKGLAGMLGFEAVSSLAHLLEETLDGLRMGRLIIDASLIEMVGEALDSLRGLVAGGEADADAVDASRKISARIQSFSGNRVASTMPLLLASLGLDDQTRRSLTEYEEHRLAENAGQGRAIYLVRVLFDFADFEEGLRSLTRALGESGEVVSTLPGIDPDGGSGIAFRLLFASELGEEALQALAGADANVEVLRRQGSASASRSAVPEHAAQPLSPTVRVDVDTLDHMLNLVGELIVAKGRMHDLSQQLKNHQDRRSSVDLTSLTRSIERKLDELHRSLVRVRMVAMGQLFSRVVRSSRKLAGDLGKEVEVTVEGESTELDKRLVELLADPLLHLLRNSIDHGIEPSAERTASGKPATGRITLRAFPQGNSVIVEVSDDGRGIDVDAVRSIAVSRGLFLPTDDPDEERLLAVLFSPGFSTTTEVTDVSGRGVGLDVVKQNIEQLRGTIDVLTVRNQGTTFRIVLPITLATMPALIVREGGERFAIPMAATVELFHPSAEGFADSVRRSSFDFRGQTLPLLRLDDLVGQPQRVRAERGFVLITRSADRSTGILIDAVESQQEILIKSTGGRLKNVRGIAGATELREGEVMLVLDLPALVADSSSRVADVS